MQDTLTYYRRVKQARTIYSRIINGRWSKYISDAISYLNYTIDADSWYVPARKMDINHIRSQYIVSPIRILVLIWIQQYF